MKVLNNILEGSPGGQKRDPKKKMGTEGTQFSSLIKNGDKVGIMVGESVQRMQTTNKTSRNGLGGSEETSLIRKETMPAVPRLI